MGYLITLWKRGPIFQIDCENQPSVHNIVKDIMEKGRKDNNKHIIGNLKI